MASRHTGFKPEESLIAAGAIEADLDKLVQGLSEAQFHAPSRSGGWSVGFCIEHLVLSGQAFLGKWDSAMKSAPGGRSPTSETVSYPLWNRLMLTAFEPPYSIKTKAIQSLVPSGRRSIEDTVRRFFNMHREFVCRIDASIGVDAKQTKVQSPFVSWVWYPLGFSFDLALTHERRHLWQAWQVRQQFLGQER